MDDLPRGIDGSNEVKVVAWKNHLSQFVLQAMHVLFKDIQLGHASCVAPI